MASSDQKAEESLMHALEALRGMIDAQGEQRSAQAPGATEGTAMIDEEDIPVLREAVDTAAIPAQPAGARLTAEALAPLLRALDAHIDRSVEAAARDLAEDLKRRLREEVQTTLGGHAHHTDPDRG